MARSKSSKAWLKRHVNDPYVHRAKAQGYRSRSAYKLIEIAKRDKLVRPGDDVVDLGAAPGGWAQALAERVGRAGRAFYGQGTAGDGLSGVPRRDARSLRRSRFAQARSLEGRLQRDVSIGKKAEGRTLVPVPA